MKKLYEIAFNKSTITAIMAVVVLLSVFSCRKKDDDKVDMKFDPETTPSMVTDSVVTLISDSGITRYKLMTDSWHIFDKAKDPHWYFPQGIYLERFDENLNVEATIVADSAWNFTNKKLWRLKGNVEITNMEGDEFSSDELFWDQDKAKVYSDKYIEIKKGSLEFKGYGFVSNQEMTDYTISRPHDGRMPYEEKEDTLTSPSESKPVVMDSLTQNNETIK